MKKRSDQLANNCKEAARVLKLLAHPERLKLLCLLSSGEMTVNELTSKCELSQSGVSQCLGRMKQEGLLTARRDGHFVFYSISDPRVSHLVSALSEIFCH